MSKHRISKEAADELKAEIKGIIGITATSPARVREVVKEKVFTIIDSMVKPDNKLKWNAGDKKFRWDGESVTGSHDPEDNVIIRWVNVDTNDGYPYEIECKDTTCWVAEDSLSEIEEVGEEEEPSDDGYPDEVWLTRGASLAVQQKHKDAAILYSKVKNTEPLPELKPFGVKDFVCLKGSKTHEVFQVISWDKECEVPYGILPLLTGNGIDAYESELRFATDEDWTVEVDDNKYEATVDDKEVIIVKVDNDKVLLSATSMYSERNKAFMTEFCKRYEIPIRLMNKKK